MPTFSDNFNRANGPLGANWTSPNNWISISGNQAVAATSSYARCTAFSDVGAHTASVTYSVSGTFVQQCYVFVKANDAMTALYSAFLTGSPGGHTATIYKVNGGVNLGTAYVPVNFGATVKYTLAYNNGFLTFYVNDVPYCWAQDSINDANTRTGFAIGAQPFAATQFDVAGVATATFHVYPDAAVSGGQPKTIYLTGDGTAWTPGSPGSPSFTASAGALSDQSVQSAGQATATFTPPSETGSVTITDPSTGLTATIYVSPTGQPGPGSPGLTDSIVAYLQRSADAEVDSTIVNRNEVVNLYAGTKTISEVVTSTHEYLTAVAGQKTPDAATLVTLDQLFAALWGGEEWLQMSMAAPGTDSLATRLATHVQQLSDVQGAGGVTLATLAAALDAVHGVGGYDLTDIYNAIGAPDLSAILTAISALRGDDAATVKAALDQLSAIRTGSDYDLADVKAWIDALPQGDGGLTGAALLAIIAAIALAIPTGGATLAVPVIAAGGGAVGVMATLFEVASIIGTLADLAADVLDIKNALSGGTGTGSGIVAPVWPGEDGVTISQPLTMSDGLTIEGPFDGLLFDITDQPSGASYYGFGERRSWRYVGSVLFITDRGDAERAESIGIDAQIVVPRTMAHAGSAILRLNGGWEGTVCTWTVNTEPPPP